MEHFGIYLIDDADDSGTGSIVWGLSSMDSILGFISLSTQVPGLEFQV